MNRKGYLKFILVISLFLVSVFCSEQVLSINTAPENNKQSSDYWAKLADQWVGLSPGKETSSAQFNRKAHPSLWSLPSVKANMIKTLGSERFMLVTKRWSMLSSIDRVENYMLFTAQKSKDGGRHRADIYISTRDGSVQACWHDEDVMNDNDIWIRSGEKLKKLSKGGCESDSVINELNIK